MSNTKTKKEVEKDIPNLREELKDYIDLNLKKELKEFIDTQLKKDLIQEVEKANKKVIKEKNKKILQKNILIILLLAVIALAGYQLYELDYFARFFVKDYKPTEKVEEKKTETKDEPVEEKAEPTLDELKEKYEELLDPIVISTNSKYIEDYYNGNLTDELKLYLAFNQMDIDALEVEDDYNVISKEELKRAYQKLFNDSFETSNFDYNGNKVRYINRLNTFMTDSIIEKELQDITREIIEIKEEKDEVVITTVEGHIKEGRLYNVVSNEEIDYDGEGLSNYKDQLNTLEYTFEEEKLIAIKRVEDGI